MSTHIHPIRCVCGAECLTARELSINPNQSLRDFIVAHTKCREALDLAPRHRAAGEDLLFPDGIRL